MYNSMHAMCIVPYCTINMSMCRCHGNVYMHVHVVVLNKSKIYITNNHLLFLELVAKLRNHPIKLPAPTQLTPLSKAMAACSGGNVTALKALLQSGVIRVNQICDPKNDGTLLHTAVYCGQV